MITRSILILVLLALFAGVMNGQTTGSPKTSAKELSNNPLTIELTPASLSAQYGKFLKVERFTIKKAYKGSQKDTIIKFSKGKTEIFFFRPLYGPAVLMTANIYDDRIKLKGDIATGISVQDFYNRVNYPRSEKDTVQIFLPDGEYKTTYIFRKNILKQINIDPRKNQKHE